MQKETGVAWSQFELAAPDIAAAVRLINENYGIAYLGTTAKTGWPRISPFTPVVVGDMLIAGIMPETPKRRDLDRDSRCTVHTLPGPNDSEVVLYCRARRLSGSESAKVIASAPSSIRIANDTINYELTLCQAVHTQFEDLPGRRPFPTRARWSAESGAGC